MSRPHAVAFVAATSFLLAGCFSSGPKQETGTLVGAAAGALIGGSGGSAGGMVTGAVVGALVGNVIGGELDASDRRKALDAEYRALEYGQTGTPVQWRGRKGRHGEVVPGALYRVNAYNCREYTQTIYIDDRPAVARGTACRQPDGSWRTVG
jgi:surface antigen